MIKKILAISGLVVILLFIIYYDLIIYGLGQGFGQIKVLVNAQSIEKILEKEDLQQETRRKLLLVGEIKKYAIEQLGLQNSKNYTTIYDQKGKPILWVVRACEPFALRNKEWHFPIVGTVSYKGYFNLEKAKKLRDQLKTQGYDTYIREVSAWSTLGWFKDPLMSGVLNNSDGDLANTIIHELTHATIFIKDSLTFNENLASFIGDKGAAFFLTWKYGQDSEEFISYINTKNDRKKFSNHFVLATQNLDSLYETFNEQMGDERLIKKEAMIRSIIINLDTILFSNKNFNNRFNESLPNNAFFMSYMLYRSGQSEMDELFRNEYNEDLKKMIMALKVMHSDDNNK